MSAKSASKTKPVTAKAKSPQFWPSHQPFDQLIDFCVRGNTNPVLQTCEAGDHIAELCMLLHNGIDRSLWDRTALKEGLQARNLLDFLDERLSKHGCLKAADTIFAIAVQATFEVLRMYLRNREVFDKIAPHHKLLPLLASIHPGTSEISARMEADAKLGSKTDESRQIHSRAWFMNDAPAHIYARAIIESVKFNRELEPISLQESRWQKFDEKEGLQTVVQPFPKYVEGLNRLPYYISPECVLDYWRKGKEMIREELPDFHLRPEWESYRRRRYKTGFKPGAVQHAIFKDILAALRTIAGSNHRRKGEKQVAK